MRPGVIWDLLGCDAVFFAVIRVAVPCLGGMKSGTEWATANKLAGKYRTSLNSVTFEPEDVCFHGEFRGISRTPRAREEKQCE